MVINMSGKLPEQCCSILASTGELIVIKRGERGYYRSEWNTDSREENKNIADFANRRMGITPAQLEAMVCGSMCGWDIPGAQPQFYLDMATREKSVAITGHIKHPVLSTYFPVKGHLHTYRIMGTEVHYIDLASMPQMMLEEQLGYTYCPELVTGKPMIPVTYQQGQNGSYTLHLEIGAFESMKVEDEGYTVMVAALVGNREIALGFNPKAPHRYATWERMPERSSSSAHRYHNGKYYEQYADAMQDCENRIAAAYARYCRTPHKNHKHKDSTGRER